MGEVPRRWEMGPMVLSHQLDLLCALDGLLKLWTSFSPSGSCDRRKCNDFFFFK